MRYVKSMLFPESGTQDNTKQTRCPCLGSWIKPWLFHWLDTYHRLSQSCLVSLYRGHLGILSVHVLSFFFLPGPFCCQEKMAPLARPSLSPSACGTCHVYSYVSDTNQLPQHQTDRSCVIWPTHNTHHMVAFRVLSSFSRDPFFRLPSFILHCSLSQWGAHHIFVDSHLPYLWCCFKAKALQVGTGETDSKKKEIQHWLHLVEVHDTKSKTAHWQEQSIFFLLSFFLFFHSVLWWAKTFFNILPISPCTLIPDDFKSLMYR